MVDEIKNIRDNLLKTILRSGRSLTEPEDEQSSSSSYMDIATVRDLLIMLFNRAGKGKDEVVQIVAKEIGSAVAGMLKDPLSQIAQTQKLQISLELVPKVPEDKSKADKKSKTIRKSKSSRKK